MPLQLGHARVPRDLVNMASPVACYICAEQQLLHLFSIPFPTLLLSPGLCWDLMLFHSLSHEAPRPVPSGRWI